MPSEEKRIWGIHTKDDNLFLHQDVIAIVLTPKSENRLFFVDERYEQGFPLDENESFYIGKSIAGLKLNQSAQNPIIYLYPLEKDKIHI